MSDFTFATYVTEAAAPAQTPREAARALIVERGLDGALAVTLRSVLEGRLERVYDVAIELLVAYSDAREATAVAPAALSANAQGTVFVGTQIVRVGSERGGLYQLCVYWAVDGWYAQWFNREWYTGPCASFEEAVAAGLAHAPAYWRTLEPREFVLHIPEQWRFDAAREWPADIRAGWRARQEEVLTRFSVNTEDRRRVDDALNTLALWYAIETADTSGDETPDPRFATVTWPVVNGLAVRPSDGRTFTVERTRTTVGDQLMQNLKREMPADVALQEAVRRIQVRVTEAWGRPDDNAPGGSIEVSLDGGAWIADPCGSYILSSGR